MPRPHTSAIKTSVVMALALSTGACADNDALPAYPAELAGYDYDLTMPRPAIEDLSGKYMLASEIAVPGALFSGVETAAVLEELADDPSAAILELADATIVQAVTDAAPVNIRDQLADRIDAYVEGRTFSSKSVPDALRALRADIAAMFARVDVVSTMSLATPDADGNSIASHQIEALVFEIDGEFYTAYAPLAQSGWRANLDVQTLHLDKESDIEDARLYVGAHTMSLPIGSLAFAALGNALTRWTDGAGVRGGLGRIVDCGGFAQAVSAGCTGTTCGDLAIAAGRLCVSALDAAVVELESGLEAIAIDELRMTGGEAALFDARSDSGSRDGVIDRIERGHWYAEIDGPVGTDPIQLEGAFAGRRIGSFGGGVASPGELDIRLEDGVLVDTGAVADKRSASAEAVYQPGEPPVLGGDEAARDVWSPGQIIPGGRMVTH
jgi:hypothetical protein